MEPELPTTKEDDLRANFLLMSVSFAVGHGCSTAPLVYASSLLDEHVSFIGNGALYISMLVSALFVSVPITDRIGVKGGLFIGQVLYCIYPIGFLAALLVAMGSMAQYVCFVFASLCGGLAAGIVWTAQGSCMGHTASAIAAMGNTPRELVTEQLAARFAFYFLLFEELSKLGLSLCFSVGASIRVGLAIYIALGICAAFALANIREVPHEPKDKQPMLATALGAMRLWSDARIWLLSLTNITFGVAAAYMNGFFNAQHAKTEFGNQSIGYFTSLTILASVGLSQLYSMFGQWYGNSIPITIGAASFACIPFVILVADCCKNWGWWLVMFYVFQGSGRAVYESSNKAIFSATFRGSDTEGAFANCVLQTSLASAVCFFMSAAVSEMALLIVLLVLAMMTPIAYAGKVWLESLSPTEKLPLLDPDLGTKSA